MTIIHRVLLSPLHCANGYDAQLYMWFLLHDLFTEVLQLLRTSIALCPRQLMALTVTVEFGGGESPIGPPNGSPIRYKETTVYFISNPLESHLLYCMFTNFFTVSVLTFTHLQYITHFSPGAILCYVGLFSHSILLVPGKQDDVGSNPTSRAFFTFYLSSRLCIFIFTILSVNHANITLGERSMD